MKITTLTVGAIQTNCYLVTAENGDTAIIDPGAQAEKIAARIQKDGGTPSFILLTHGHFDHIGALAELKERYHIPAYIHDADAELLTDSAKNGSDSFGTSILSAECEHLLSDGDTITLGELTFTLLHTPGHTKGSSCYQVSRAIFTGDTLFCGGIGRTDLYGGSSPQISASLKHLAALPGDFDVYPGHGQFSTLQQERQTNPYVGEVRYDDIL